ncbi:uncharacterized protein PITG_07421 [Phytophthora infestans T30-4]|uniref:Uncharacterized protein n=1 Tax=Phytophthora infestans (strain T30-4) TaxID=403677 RepID=D0N8D2_PHYIT|nr:uncharacterized protein PITG_07421 [Phytophthora infestans T30-4]EEY53817.1 conserved hypothetical protein [Phytophthora infestans T30-4]|eukprot:XP_002904448.1 conserved hypothetical protein [Phytophthora infestans T30-4]
MVRLDGFHALNSFDLMIAVDLDILSALCIVKGQAVRLQISASAYQHDWADYSLKRSAGRLAPVDLSSVFTSCFCRELFLPSTTAQDANQDDMISQYALMLLKTSIPQIIANFDIEAKLAQPTQATRYQNPSEIKPDVCKERKERHKPQHYDKPVQARAHEVHAVVALYSEMVVAVGCGDLKAAKDFTAIERGASKFAFSRRNVFWDVVASLKTTSKCKFYGEYGSKQSHRERWAGEQRRLPRVSTVHIDANSQECNHRVILIYGVPAVVTVEARGPNLLQKVVQRLVSHGFKP